jgi:hypothetical protein
MSSRSFEKSQEEFKNQLIRHFELATVEYTSLTGKATMPLGLEKHDVYFIN